MAIEKKIHFKYEQDGVKLDFSFDSESPLLIKQMETFVVLCHQAVNELEEKIQELK